MSETKIVSGEVEMPEDKSVHLYLRGKLFHLKGSWQWSLHSQAVYCSDVMFSLPMQLEGTKGILHPDDVAPLEEGLHVRENESLSSLHFRIITTYGKVVELGGQSITITELELPDEALPFSMERESVLAQMQYTLENEKLRGALALAHAAEKYMATGTWYFNTATYAIHFSDNLFRLYGLVPQGINTHLKSFQSFLHPDDAAAYSEAFDKAYQSRAPLHLTYRIVDTLGETKYLQLLTSWDFNERGEPVLSGVVMDITAQRLAEAELEASTGQNAFLKELIHLSENMTGIGTWQIDLFTRKSSFSDNFYHIYGFKPQAARLNLELLTNFVHPEDRAQVAEVNRQILFEHQCPEIEYRIIRNDGKQRYLQLKGKLIVHSKVDLVMVGTIKDITATRMLERNEVTLTEELNAQKMVRHEVETTTGTYVWVTDLETGKTKWSQNFYTFLGYRPNLVELTQKLFFNLIHLEDRKKFTDTLHLAVQEQLENSMHFRLIIKGEVHYMKATFTPILEDGRNRMAGIIQNVSHETAVQQEHYHLQQLVAALHNTVTDKVFITDRVNTIINMNEACRKSLVAKGQEALQKNVFDVFPHLKEGDFVEHLQVAISGKPVNLPARILMKGILAGSYHMLPLLDEAQTAQHVLHVIHDKTGEHQLQQKATLHFKLVESLIPFMPGRVIVMDKHMNYVYWNEKCEAHYGIKKEEVIGKNILEFSPGFYNDPSYNEFKKTLNGEVVSLTDGLQGDPAFHEETLLVPVAGDNNDIEFILWIVYNGANSSVMVS